jgi:hypothetical protein
LQINALTGGLLGGSPYGSGHSNGYLHYSGRAVDFECKGNNAAVGKILDSVGVKYGVKSNYERCDKGYNHWRYQI